MFLHRLALELHRTVDELLDSTSWAELMTWAAFDELEPIGGRRLDMLAAYWMTHWTNMKIDLKKHEPIEMSRFMLIHHMQERARNRLEAAPVMTAAEVEAEGAKVSMETLAFLVGEAHKAGYKMEL